MRKQKGFSLFEIMLAMVIASMIAVGVAKVATQQTAVSADKLYGQNLFTYSQAAYSYVTASSSAVTSGTFAGQNAASAQTNFWNAFEPTEKLKETYTNYSQYDKFYTFSSLTWISGVLNANGALYLPANFNLNTGMSPLIVASPQGATVANPVNTGNNSLTTYVLYSSTNSTLPPLIFIASGVLYQPQPNTAGTYNLQPSLTADATNQANKMIGSLNSANPFSFNYNYTSVGAVSQVFAGLTTVAVGSTNQYLMTVGANNGGNSMLGDLNLNPQSGSATIGFANNGTITFGRSGILNNVMKMNMADGVDNSGSINFNGNGFINNLTSLAMENAIGAGLPTSITNLTQLNFDGTAAAEISGLQSLTFNSGAGEIKNLTNSSVFKGIAVTNYMLGRDSSGNFNNNTQSLGAHDACFSRGGDLGTNGACAVRFKTDRDAVHLLNGIMVPMMLRRTLAVTPIVYRMGQLTVALARAMSVMQPV